MGANESSLAFNQRLAASSNSNRVTQNNINNRSLSLRNLGSTCSASSPTINQISLSSKIHQNYSPRLQNMNDNDKNFANRAWNRARRIRNRQKNRDNHNQSLSYRNEILLQPNTNTNSSLSFNQPKQHSTTYDGQTQSARANAKNVSRKLPPALLQKARRSNSMPPASAYEIVAAVKHQKQQDSLSQAANRKTSNSTSNNIGGGGGHLIERSRSTLANLRRRFSSVTASSQHNVKPANIECGNHMKQERVQRTHSMHDSINQYSQSIESDQLLMSNGMVGAIDDCNQSLLIKPHWRTLNPIKGKAYREHNRQFRELVADWSVADLHCLVVEFDSAFVCRQLHLQAEAARQTGPTVQRDLYELFHLINPIIDESDSHIDGLKCGTDLELILTDSQNENKKSTFKCHSKLLAARSAFFGEILAAEPTATELILPESILLNLADSTERIQLSHDLWRAILGFLYSGLIPDNIKQNTTLFGPKIDQIMAALSDYFGSTNRFEEDMRSVLSSSHYTGDTILQFSSEKPQQSINTSVLAEHITPAAQPNRSVNHRKSLINRFPFINNRLNQNSKFGDGDEKADSKFESSDSQSFTSIRCHSFILAARSKFFRTIIERQIKNEFNNGVEQPSIMNITLDESVISRAYAHVLLTALYTDHVDLSKVLRGCPLSVSSLSEVQAIASGKCQLSPVEEATDVYHIALFIDTLLLAQRCEDVIVEHISVESVACIYNWASEQQSSAFVRRHCVAFVQQEFAKVCGSPVLFDLEESILIEALRSDFVQACELDILHAVVRWGEHQLVRRMEDREPNIISGTTHSISRRGVRRSDLSETELKELLADLLPLVRNKFLLPLGHHIELQAIARGLLETDNKESDVNERLVNFDIDWLHGHSHTTPASTNQHLHRKATNQQLIHKPRLFMPYYDCAKRILHKRLMQCPHLIDTLHCHTHSLVSSSGQEEVGDDNDSVSLSGGSHLRRPLVTPKHKQMVMVTNTSTTECVNKHTHTNTDSWQSRTHSLLTNGTSVSTSDSEEDERKATLPPFGLMQSMSERVQTLITQTHTQAQGDNHSLLHMHCACLYHTELAKYLIRLRVVREFGVDELYTRILKHANRYYTIDGHVNEYSQSAINEYSQSSINDQHVDHHDLLLQQSDLFSNELFDCIDLPSTSAQIGNAQGILPGKFNVINNQNLPDLMYGTDSFKKKKTHKENFDTSRLASNSSSTELDLQEICADIERLAAVECDIQDGDDDLVLL